MPIGDLATQYFADRNIFCAGRVAKDASALYSKNIFNFLSLIINKDDGKINLNWEDEIVNAVILTNDGLVRLEQFK